MDFRFSHNKERKVRLMPLSAEKSPTEKLEEIGKLTERIEEWLESEEILTKESEPNFSKGLYFGIGLALELVSGKIKRIQGNAAEQRKI